MERRLITREHAEVLLKSIQSMERYLLTLKNRIETLDVAPTHPILKNVTTAYNAVYAVRISMFYETVERPGEKKILTNAEAIRLNSKPANSDGT